MKGLKGVRSQLSKVENVSPATEVLPAMYEKSAINQILCWSLTTTDGSVADTKLLLIFQPPSI